MSKWVLALCATLALTLPLGGALAATIDVDITYGNITISPGTNSGLKIESFAAGGQPQTADDQPLADTVIHVTGSSAASQNHKIVVDGVGAEPTPVKLTLDTLDIECSNASALRIQNNGWAEFTLKGDNHLKTTSREYAAIAVPYGSTLWIAGSGTLEATAAPSGPGIIGFGAGIGGSKNEECGTVTIYSGTVTARTTSAFGAGIGGSRVDVVGAGNGRGGNGGTVTIYGGTVTAQSGSYGAAIGGGGVTDTHAGNGGTVTIYGGTVTAQSGSYGAAIGGGNGYYSGDGGTVEIHGGTVTATATWGAAIGGGGGTNGGNGGTVNLYGGTVTATATWGAAIGGGCGSSGSGTGGNGGTVNLEGGILQAESTHGASIGGSVDQYTSLIGSAATVTFAPGYSYKWSRTKSELYAGGTVGGFVSADHNGAGFTGIWPAVAYAIASSPQSPADMDFGTVAEGGSVPPQTMTITNIGYDAVTFTPPVGTSAYTLALNPTTLAKNGDTATLTVTPITANPGTFAHALTATGSGGVSVGANARLIVTETHVATPAFSPSTGSYAVPQNVTLSCSTVGAILRYTTNGEDPTETSALYTGTPIVVSSTATVKAKGFKAGLTPSEVASAAYTISNPYQIVSGQHGEWSQGSGNGLTFTANGSFDDFTGIDIDGNPVASHLFAAQSGSTVITLKASYLETLAVGLHTLRVHYRNGGYAETDFTIQSAAPQPALPRTGDSSRPMLWLTLAALAAALAGLQCRMRRAVRRSEPRE